MSDAFNEALAQVAAEKEVIANNRIETWRLTIEQELQTLITQAADMRKTINEAHTNVKKKYYTKKFKKISEQVIQLLAVQSRLPSPEQPTGNSTNESTNSISTETTP